MRINISNLAFALFFFYILLLMTVSFLGVDIHNLRARSFEGVNHNFIPFKTISEYIIGIDRYNFDTWFNNTLGNVLLFFPLGFLLPLMSSNLTTLKSVLGISFMLSTFIEVIQYAAKLGVLDIDDILLNLFGATLGFIIYLILTKLLK
ncbi:VanZ family protein [Bacillus sp. AK031]